jgi:DNA-binding NtrC family response regulator
MQILIVSKDTILNQILYDYLSDQGHSVNYFISFLEFFKASNQVGSRADLLLVDFDLKYDDQLKLLKEIRISCPYIPIICIVYVSSILPADKSFLYGIYGYLRKPISLSEMDLLISRLNKENSTFMYNHS